MRSPFARVIDRLNLAYRERSFFEALKARLLATIALLVMVYIPLNIAKNLWLRPTLMAPRMALNVVVWLAGAACLRAVLKGRLERAGNGLALSIALAVHGTILIVALSFKPIEPLSVGIHAFAFDMIILVLAILFSSRLVATLVLAILVVAHTGYYFFMLRVAGLDPMVRAAADVLLREGLLSMGAIFLVGITLIQMIEASHRRSEETLLQSVSVNRDLQRLERETRLLSERRRDFLERQREFISMVSHEFRTPLTTVQGAQYLLDGLLLKSGALAGGVAEKVERWLGLQGSGLTTLNRLVDQVLMLNRTEHMTGGSSFELQAPGSVLSETVAHFNDSTATPRVVLRAELPKEFAAPMDPSLVKAAAENLISNGLKYSEADKLVQVRVYLEPEGWAIEVADEGRGIPAADQARVFHPFFRAGNVGTVPGTGLGLAIVRRAVDFHAGRIEFESKVNAGTRFRVHFPNVVQARLEGAPQGRVLRPDSDSPFPA